MRQCYSILIIACFLSAKYYVGEMRCVSESIRYQ